MVIPRGKVSKGARSDHYIGVELYLSDTPILLAIALCPQLFRPDDTEKGTKARLAIIWFGTNDCISSDRPQHVGILDLHDDQVLVLTPISRYHWKSIKQTQSRYWSILQQPMLF